MRELIIPESGPKRILLSAAEHLFATKGFEAVSVRDVTQAVKTNVAAVNYHFGSREQMLSLVILRYAIPVNEERLARLASAERKFAGKSLPVEEIIEAFVRPIIGQSRKTELPEGLFYQLLGRIFAANGDGLSQQFEENFSQVSDRFMRALGKALPTLAPEELGSRYHLINGGLIHLLTHQELLGKREGSPPTMEASLGRLIRFNAAGLREGVAAEADAPVQKEPQETFNF